MAAGGVQPTKHRIIVGGRARISASSKLRESALLR
jgi:hypothetical protein